MFLEENSEVICRVNESIISSFGVSQILLLFCELSDVILVGRDEVFIGYIRMFLDCT